MSPDGDDSVLCRRSRRARVASDYKNAAQRTYKAPREALIKALSDFAKSIFMQGKEKDDENSKLFKESFDAALYKYAAKSDSSI